MTETTLATCPQSAPRAWPASLTLALKRDGGRTVLARKPGNSEAQALMAELAVRNGDARVAVRILEKLLAADPDNYLYHTQIAVACALQSRFPAVHLQALTAVEIVHIADRAKMSVRECLERLNTRPLKKLKRSRRDLFEAMVQIARTGKGPQEQIPSMGCSIKWKGEAA